MTQSSSFEAASEARELAVQELNVVGFCDYFQTPMTGGSEIVTREIYSRLDAMGAEACVVSAIPGATRGWTPVGGIDTMTFPMRDLSRLLGLQVGLAPGLMRAAEQVTKAIAPNVLHGSSIHFRSTVVAARLARRLGIPLVTTAHLGSVEHLSRLARTATSLYERSVGRYILETSARVIAVSHSVLDHLISLRVPAEKITVIENGVDTERFQPADRSDPRRIVFLGRLIANKGPVLALEAFSRAVVDGWQLLFVGDGPLNTELQARARELGLDDQVVFLGEVPDAAPILNTSDILIRPSLTEGRALAVLEAMSSGMSVVISDIAANRELVRHNETGILVPLDEPDAWAEELAGLMRDPDRRVGIGAAARSDVIPFSWDGVARQTGALLLEAASERVLR